MLSLPPHWTTAPASQLMPVAAGPSLLLLDYDGTLAPFQDDRMEAVPWPGMAQRLDALSVLPSVHLALITGRSARELAEILPVKHPVEIWGSHGREHLTAAGEYSVAPLAPTQQAALDDFAADLESAGLSAYVERKPASLAAHWRTLDSAGAVTLQKIARDSYFSSGERAGLQMMLFEGGVELRSPSINKGHAALHMITQLPMAVAAYLGDDVTDEDAFTALRGRAFTLLVRDHPRPSQADYWLRPPGDVLDFLDSWIQAAERAIA